MSHNTHVKTILILAANPINSSRLRLDEEVREITAALLRAKNRSGFEIVTGWATRVEDLHRALLEYQPTIVHFSGHGDGSNGLALSNNFGQVQLVSTEPLARLFGLFQDTIECVLLNACYSLDQAEAIHQHIDYVVGMNQAIGDVAAIKFATGFYDALGAGRRIEDCFEVGRTMLSLQGIPEDSTPVLKARRRRNQTEIKINPLDVIPVKSSVDDSIGDDNKSTQNRSVSIGGNVTGSAVLSGDHNVANVHFQPVSLPAPARVDIRAEFNALREVLTCLETSDCRKIDNAFADAQEELNKLQPDKNEVGKALDRALDYAKKAEGFASVVEKIKPHMTKATAWLGENWHKLLSVDAGHPLDEAVVNLLLKDTEGREGALPLLQFALTRIWEGLKNGVQSVKTLEQIGGVGGALADEAQRIYENLNDQEKKIAKRVFIGLVQLGEGTSDTRRRTNINSLVSYKDEPEYVKKVIDKFAHPGVRLVTLSSVDGTETAEVTHEALFANWGQMKEWLDSSRNDIRFQRRLDEAARVWDENSRPEGSLWRPPDLDLLKKYKERTSENMTPLQVDFFQASLQAENNRKRLQRFGIGGLVVALFFLAYGWQSSEKERIEQAALAAKGLSSADPLTSLVRAISLVGQSRSPLFSFPNQSLPPSVQDSLFSAVQDSREKNVLRSHQGSINSVAISTDGQTIVSGGQDGTVLLWDSKGKQLATFRGHQRPVMSVAISTDKQTIVSGSQDGTVRLWDSKGKQLATLRGHQSSVFSVAISTDGRTIVSGGEDGTVRLWDSKGKQLATLRGHQGYVRSVAISTDGQTIVSGGRDQIVRLWDIRFESWLKAACERLQDHPVFQNPQTPEERGAKATCEPYLKDL